ncbi:20103_t:CDS:1 [Gigaspora rosea]|nr:20103_t:CDS:1 [Gigaspora rosea]
MLIEKEHWVVNPSAVAVYWEAAEYYIRSAEMDDNNRMNNVGTPHPN